MQANNIEAEVKDLATKLVSLEPADFDAAVNQYFEANAVLDTKLALVRGASRIKKVALLQSLLASDSKLMADPKYDDSNKLVRFAFERTYITPALPSYIPLGHLLSKKSTTIHWIAKVHLHADDGEESGEGSGNKLYVTKIDELRRREQLPLENVIPFFILRPIFTILTLMFANIASFWVRHKHDGLAKFTLAALEELVGAVWYFLLAETGKRQAQVDVWTEEKRGQASQLYTQALTSAASLQSDLEARAKKAGIPVEQYKAQLQSTLKDLQTRANDIQSDLERRAKNANIPLDQYKGQVQSILTDLRSKAGELQGDLEGRAKNAGVPVEEYRKQVEQIVQDLQKRAQTLGEYFDSKAAEKTTNDTPAPGTNDKNEFPALVPTTPLGGHDPTAPNAPSYAAAAAE